VAESTGLGVGTILKYVSDDEFVHVLQGAKKALDASESQREKVTAKEKGNL